MFDIARGEGDIAGERDAGTRLLADALVEELAVEPATRPTRISPETWAGAAELASSPAISPGQHARNIKVPRDEYSDGGYKKLQSRCRKEVTARPACGVWSGLKFWDPLCASPRL